MDKIKSQKIIIVNSGSVSKKYALFEGENAILFAHFEKLQNGYQVNIKRGEAISRSENITQEQYNNGFNYFIDLLIDRAVIENEKEITAVAFRIVAPGKVFQNNKIIDEDYLLALDEIAEQSPIHIRAMRKEMNQIMDRISDVTIVAISDSDFHKTQPDYASNYAISNKFAEAYGLYRYGYHGISVSSVVEKLKLQNKLPSRVIVCHLGGGSSLTAVLDGKSIENSMGYSPLEGVAMSTRSGNIDAGAVLAIMDNLDYEPDEMKDILFNSSGIKAVSEVSSDMRDILAGVEKGDTKSILAFNLYTYDIKKQIGAYIAALNGLDLLIFTGTVGERSHPVRQKICEGLDNLGIILDENLNKKAKNEDVYINKPGSPVSIKIVYTDEMTEMARQTIKLI